jgi:hypothetical protein
MTDRKSTTQLKHEAQAQKAFSKNRAEDQRTRDVLAGEVKRVSSNAAKTAKLRALREGRDASEPTQSKVHKKWRMPPPTTS